MEIILTHEQADFDALAALLGAHLLKEHAIPVLPRRINRNARAFLTIYGTEFPFVEPVDLAPDPIDRVNLVDTQSLVTLRGMARNVQVHVVDHHPLRTDLPENWTVTTDKVGACTTLFVENLRDHNGALNPIHATLLLLGIYEDTGALTYPGTTPRDVHAAAFLLEQGASLRIASEYLNPPLSSSQKELYHELLSSAETHRIQGQNILVSSANAESLNEEISGIAHKLRDLLDPDALFILVSTQEGIRLVARSTTDQIDVSKVATKFGGGGHDRAAAALIHPDEYEVKNPDVPPLKQVCTELIQLLPEIVRPSVTVGQIMSRHPMLLSPQTSAPDAAQIMRRYGYEGFPVVQDGRVIGLLTRRAVDRALAHKLNLPASSLMEAGEVSVTPQDVIDTLQQVMTTSGWGQIPVVDPQTKKIVGIVTRTDLLKTLSAGEKQLPGQLNLADRLEAALPPRRLEFLKLVAAQAHAQHLAIYIVGGFVRDLLLNRPSQDFDIVVEGDAISLARNLASHYGGRMVSHGRFGTAKWWVPDSFHFGDPQDQSAPADVNDLPESLDLISARTEFYDYPTALPTIERSSIKLDLHRRDFTINTMALRLDGRHYGSLYDYWGGYHDLKQGWVRVLHSLSFVDDPTRMLRAVRFEQRFNFRIEQRTIELMNEAGPLLRQVSGQRLRHELDLMLGESRPAAMLTRLEELHLLTAIHPALTWNGSRSAALEAVLFEPLDPSWKLPTSVEDIPIRRMLAYLVWLIGVPEAGLASISDRLRFPGHLRNALIDACTLLPQLSMLKNEPPSTATAILEAVPLSSLYALNQIEISEEARQIILNYVQKWRYVKPVTRGNTLVDLGVKPGPAYRYILETLRTAWLDGKINSVEQEQALLQNLLGEDFSHLEEKHGNANPNS
jgi:tRNA nucleotidyltransferase (CCA-adding enzyme)